MATVQFRPTITTSKNDVNLLAKEGKSVQEIINELNIPMELNDSLSVSINGSYIPSSAFKFITPKEGSDLKILLVPEGDDNFRLVALLAVAIFAPYAAPAAWGTFASAALTIGITIVGTLAVNAIFPPPEAPEFQTSDGGSAALTITGTQNKPRYDKGVQRIYGTVKNYPAYGAQPFTISHGSSQFLYALFDMGYGDIECTDLKIGDTLLSEFQEVDYNIVNNVTTQKQLEYFSNDIDSETVNVSLKDGDPATVRTSPSDIKSIQFDIVFGGGLVGFDETGAKVGASVVLDLVLKDDQGVALLTSEYFLRDLYNDLPDVTISIVGSTITIAGTIEDGFALTFEATPFQSVTTDFLTLELSRTSSFSAGLTSIDDSLYSTFRSFLNGEVFKDFRILGGGQRVEHTMIEMRIKATDQLSGIIDSFNCIASSKLRKWNGTSFDAPAVTDNPAWIYADVLTGTLNQRAKPDSKIDWDELKRWADFCDEPTLGQENNFTKAHTCNFVLDYSVTLFALLKDIAAIGRASPDISDDMYSVIFEEEKSLKVQLFTNMNTSNFSSNRAYTELPDAVKVSFKDPENDWVLRDSIVYNDGFDENNAEVFETIAVPMTTSSDEAYRNGRYWLKQATLRQEQISFTTDIDWLECKRGSFIGFQHDVAQVGGSVARVKAVNGNIITLDSDANMNGNDVVTYELRPQTGSIVSGIVSVFSTDAPKTVDLGTHQASKGDLIIFNGVGQNSYDLLVKSIDVNSNYTATINCVEYAPALFDLASDPVPTYDPGRNLSGDPSSTPNILQTLTATETLTLVNDVYYTTIKLAYTPDFGSIPETYKVYKQNASFGWDLVATTSQLTYRWGESVLITSASITGVSHSFAVVGVSSTDNHLEPAVGKQVSITPTGDTTKPIAPDYFNVENTAENTRRFWWGYNVNQADDDLKGFQIRYTRSTLEDWSAATPLHDGVLLEPPYEIRALPEGAQIVMIRSLDVAGNFSEGAQSIGFNLGERPTENVLWNYSFRTNTIFLPDWDGFAVQGNPVIISNALSADTSTSGVMWSTVVTDLMWNDDAALMWNSPNDGFVWASNVTVPSEGITTVSQEGQGELKLSYASGIYPDNYRQLENGVPVPYAEEFPLGGTDTIEWVGQNITSTLQTNVSLRIGPDGSTNKVWRLVSTGNASNLRIHTYPIGSAGKTYFSLFIRKGITDRFDGHFPAVQLGQSPSSYHVAFMLDKKTGETAWEQVAAGVPTGVEVGSEDHGDWWLLWGTFDQATTQPMIKIFPSYGYQSDFVYDAFAFGAATDVFGAMVQRSVERLDYNPLSALIHNGAGMGQGVIPYTSPVNLEAGDYTIIVDSAKSVDVNKLTELDWATDVDDINEWKTGINVASSGTTIIPLIKPFSAITNVSFTVVANGHDTTVSLVNKTTTYIEVQCFKTGTGNQTAGTIDMRVQGY